MKRRLLTVSHSYVVALNRRMAVEFARAGSDGWEVTVAAPRFFQGDLRPIALEQADDEPFRLIGLPTYLTRLTHLFVYGTELRTLLRKRWDVIHAWEEPYVLSGAELAWFAPPSSRLVFATFQNLSKAYPPPFAQLERFAMRRAAGWIAYGHSSVQALEQRPGYAERPMTRIPIGVDVERFRPDVRARLSIRERLGWPRSGPPIVGYMGRFVPEKGIALLMKALEGLTSPWRALFIGGGSCEGELRRWAAGRGDQVRILSNVSHDDVPGYLAAMDLLCAPSQTTTRWKEQFGRMLTEAFACGVPVVASDSGEIPYTVGDAGVVLPERDLERWIHVLDGLLQSPSRREELSARGLARARDAFAWPVVARAHLAFFEQLLDQRRTPA